MIELVQYRFIIAMGFGQIVCQEHYRALPLTSARGRVSVIAYRDQVANDISIAGVDY